MFGLSEQGKRAFAVICACITLSAAAVVIRIICKRLQKSMHLDDYWIITALLFACASDACLIWGSITGGGGKEMKDILTSGNKDTPQEVENYLEVRLK